MKQLTKLRQANNNKGSDIIALLFIVVDRGKANSVLHKAQEYGATGGTIFFGEGTIQSKFLKKLGITETHKEILVIETSDGLCDNIQEALNEEFKFTKRNKGIAFSIPFMRWQLKDNKEQRELPKHINTVHFCIMTIVDKGKSKDCIESAKAAGAKGGTIIHGRGAGIPTDFYYPLVIEPQKDIIMIITGKDKVAEIKERITSELELEKTGNGIIFVLPVLKAYGLIEDRPNGNRR